MSSIYLPLGISELESDWSASEAPADTARRRDGLSRFDPGLFLDAELSDLSTERLAAAADHLRYQSRAPRRLRGIHALFGVEEATLIGIPDAVHRSWQPVTTPAQFQAQVDAARRAGRTSVLLLAKRGNGPETFVGIDLTAR